MCISDYKLTEFETYLFVIHELFMTNLQIYYRPSIDKMKYIHHRGTYKHLKTNSYTVQINRYDKTVYGFIRFFCNINSKLFLVLDTFKIQHDVMFVQLLTQNAIDHILPIKNTSNEMIILDFDEIVHILCFLSHQSIITFVNDQICF